MVQASADPSTRTLSEVARHLVIPTGIVDSVWFDLEERFDEWGVEFDAWQDGLGQLLLGVRDDGKYATTVGGSTISIPRQVAKTFIVGRATFALCSHFDEQTWLWTAHRTRTATQTFQKLAAFASRKAVKSYLLADRSDGIRSTNGEQEIRFKNGSRLLFGAREQGFGRGFDEIDGEVFDEAQILTERALDDMVPATNQSRNPHGALLIYMGTPPRPTDPGEVFKARRRAALAAKPDGFVVHHYGDALFVETSADPETGRPGGPSLDDPLQIRKANPSYPHRTPPESIKRMRANLGSDDSWLREALGVWDDDAAGSRAIDGTDWSLTAVPLAPSAGVKYFGVAFSLDGDRVALVGALKHDSGVHVELVDAMTGDTETGIALLAEWLTERADTTAKIVISGKAGSVVLAQKLRKLRVSSRLVHVASTPDYLAACSIALDAVKGSARVARAAVDSDVVPALPFTHLAVPGQAQLDDSIASCDKVQRGRDGSWGWGVTTEDGDETPIEAMSLAVWAATSEKRPKTGQANFA